MKRSLDFFNKANHKNNANSSSNFNSKDYKDNRDRDKSSDFESQNSHSGNKNDHNHPKSLNGNGHGSGSGNGYANVNSTHKSSNHLNNDGDHNSYQKDLLPVDQFSGIYNQGNMCYCSSVLQALYACAPFRNEILNYKSMNQWRNHYVSDDSYLVSDDSFRVPMSHFRFR